MHRLHTSTLNLHYTRGITPKRVTKGGAHLCGLARGQHSYEKTSQRWRIVRDSVCDLTGPAIEPITSLIGNDTLTTETELTVTLILIKFDEQKTAFCNSESPVFTKI